MWVGLFSISLKGQALDSGAKEGGGGEGRSGTQPPGAHGLVPRLYVWKRSALVDEP